MRPLFLFLILAGLIVLAIAGCGVWQYSRQFPKASVEVVELTPQSRGRLHLLRAEHKYQPHDFPPLGYTGADSPEDEEIAVSAVNGVLDAILIRPDGPLPAKIVEGQIRLGMAKVRNLATEDRDRTQEYMVEIWYSLGFRGATGLFAYGSYFVPPPGYGEPLPVGWNSPTQPRPIGD